MESVNQALVDLGWRPFFSADILDAETHHHPVRVLSVHRGKIAVAGAASLRFVNPHMPDAVDEDDHPTVGDWLLLDEQTQQPVRILRRQSLFKRRAPGTDRKSQLIAANVDTVFLVASCNQDFSAARLERYLVLAREVGVNPVVVLTKTDLTETPETFVEAVHKLQPGLLVKAVDARDPASVASLAMWCAKGETVALMGSSGVGKSTLVNSLRGSDSIATQAIRKGDGTGRHTTTVREMHRLDHGGWLLDTPGMRELQLSDAAVGIAEIFDDIVAAAENCRFSDCAHEVEPGCAVQALVAEGALLPTRLDRWRRLAMEEQSNSATLAQRRGRQRR